MSLDAIAKRYFPAIVCALLLVVAFFQARGIGALVAGQLPDVNAAPAAGPHAPLPVAAGPARALNAKPILARNAFDSITGPLDAPPAPPPTPTAPPAADPSAEDPPCPSGSIVLIAEDADPAWSFAMIRTSGGAKMRRVGDEVDGQKVKQIAWDRVWLSSGAGRCQLKLDITKSRPAGPATPGKPGTPSAGRSDAPTPSGDVTKVSDTEYIVSRAAVERAQGFGNELRKGTSLVPGHGVRLQMVPGSSLLGQVGIQTGDIVKSINGFDLTDLDKATEGYSRLKTAKDITLAIERNNTPMTINVRMQ